MSVTFPYHPATPAPTTLKERVAAFWQWYSAHAAEFYETIEQKECGSLQPSVSAAVDALLPGMAWVFGPGADGVGHSFTLSPEAHPYRRLVAQYWLSQAPKLPGWTFYSSRQAGKVVPGMSIRIGEEVYKPEEIWVTPWVDEHYEMVDLTIWHAAFANAPENHRGLATFLWLDEMLSENDVFNWIGEIKFGDDKLSEAISLMELPEFIADLQAQRGWKKYPPSETYSSYRGPADKETADDEDEEDDENESEQTPALRSDIVAGTTLLFRLVRDYPLEENPLAAWGADLMMIVLRTDQLPEGNQVAERGKLEDALDQMLRSNGAGMILGGATGHTNSYIDLAFYDGERSKQLVLDMLAAGEFGDSAWLSSFAA